MSAFAWVKQAYERPICAEFVQPKRSWKDRRITGAAWSMSRSECFSRRPPTCACSHTHPHSQAHSCHRQAAKDHSQKHPPSRLCFPKYLWHTHTHTHSQWGSMWRFITQQCRQCAVAATVHSLPRRLLSPCPSFGGCWDRILLLKQKRFALREVWWANAKVWVSLRTVQRAYS